MFSLDEKKEDCLYIDRMEYFYDMTENEIDYDTFKQLLSENHKVSVKTNELKLLYNQDKTKLRLVIYTQTKKFVQVPQLQRVVPKKTISYVGCSINLKTYNIYSYIIHKDPKTKKCVKSIRCNDFIHMGYNMLDILTRPYFNAEGEFTKIITSALNLDNNDYKNISNLLFAIYLKKRNIEYYDISYLNQFKRIFVSRSNKYNNTDIFTITQKLLSIQNVEYVKLLYNSPHVNKVNGFFYHMCVLDALQVDLINFKPDYLHHMPTGTQSTTNDSIDKTRHVVELIRRLKPYYNIKISDVTTSNCIVNLELLYYLLSFGKKANIEHFSSVGRIENDLWKLIHVMWFSKLKNGYEIYNTESLDYIEKFFPPDKYRINYDMCSSDLVKLYENNESSTNPTHLFRAMYTIMRSDGQLRKLVFFSATMQMFFQDRNMILDSGNSKKFNKLKKAIKNDYAKYFDLFFVQTRFCEKDFLVLCKEHKINHTKYISNI